MAGRQAVIPHSATEMLSRWTNRGMEPLWLSAVVLVPLAFLGQNYALSEAVIAYVEVPKIALLRTLAGLMAILWLVEWGIQGRLPRLLGSGGLGLPLRPSLWLARLASWLRDQPVRWLLLAVWFFLGTALTSTFLSASLKTSLWGEIPGQDGFSAYTIVAYVLLFGVIATHLKTKAQLWRLMWAIVVVGVLVSSFGVLQYYGHDFLNLAEPTGGAPGRVTSFMANADFAGAAMMLPIPITLLVATFTLREPVGSSVGFRGKMGKWTLALVVAAFWVSALTVQLLGITFTFTRGAWLGTILALAVLLGLLAFGIERRLLSRAALVLGLAAALTLAVIQWPEITPLPAIGGLLSLIAIFLMQGSGRVRIGLGFMVGLLVVGVVASIWLSGTDKGVGNIPEVPTGGGDSTATRVASRFSSIAGEVTGNVGSFEERREIWRGSWRLIRDRPWFEFDTLSLPWLRPLIGYGPDLFRFTFLLESRPAAGNFPVEADHAHNYLLHQTVEQGVLGLLSSIGILVTPLLLGCYQLLRHRKDYAQVHILVLAGLLAALAGRFLEQLVGLARVSDLTLYWVLLAVFAALPTVMAVRAPLAKPVPRANQDRRRRRANALVPHVQPTLDWKLCWRLALISWLIGGICVFTWVKAINYPKAAVAAGNAFQNLDAGNAQAALTELERATRLAPDVPVYHNYRAGVYLLYRDNKEWPPERGCSSQKEVAYDSCLAQLAYLSNLAGAGQRPFYWRSRLALADSAFLLRMDEEAIQLYQETIHLVPYSWALHNRMATVYLEVGNPQAALEQAEESLALTKASANSEGALQLKQEALQELSKGPQPATLP